MQDKIKYVPSIFDLSITDSIEYLVKNKSEHQLFRTAKELLDELSVTNTSYISIRNKKRGYTKNQIPHIISILNKKYGVSEEWLRFRRGNIMAIPVSKEGKKAMSYDAAMNEIEKLKIELQHKTELLQNTKAILEESREMVRQQQILIKKLSK
jgi:hypothetical protein